MFSLYKTVQWWLREVKKEAKMQYSFEFLRLSHLLVTHSGKRLRKMLQNFLLATHALSLSLHNCPCSMFPFSQFLLSLCFMAILPPPHFVTTPPLACACVDMCMFSGWIWICNTVLKKYDCLGICMSLYLRNNPGQHLHWTEVATDH